MEPLYFEGQLIREPDYSQLQQEKCLEQDSDVKRPSKQPDHSLLDRKKNFNDPSLPGSVDENTVFGIKTKSEFGISEVIFPNTIYDENFDEFYKISHRAHGTGEQLNRKYSGNFDPNYRYGKHLKWLPAGVWFKNNVKESTPSDDKNDITDYIGKLLQSEKNENCNNYPYVDNRQGKFFGRSYLRAGHIITGEEPDEKELEIIDYLSAVNKTKSLTKKKKYNLKELRDTYKSLDRGLTGWLPLELVYAICYRRQIRPEKRMFDLALNSIRAIDAENVRYDSFVDLLDPNVQFSVNLDIANKSAEPDRFTPTYKTDYENRFSRSVELNKNLDDDASTYTPVKPIVLAHQDCFGSETDVKTLLSPTIFTNYGLTYRDFYIGRSKAVMEKLFKDVGVNLPDDVFNAVWNIAYQCDGFDEKVSVEVFKRALQEFAHKAIG